MILTSDKLPKPFAERLKKALAPYPNIHAAFMPPAPVQEAFSSAMAELPSTEAAPDEIRITFRLDDDAAAADFADYMERYRKPQYLGFRVSLSKGLGLCRLQCRTRIRERRRSMRGAGLAHVGASNAGENISGIGNHMREAERMPAIAAATRPAFPMTSRGSNDSSSRVPLKARLRPWTLMTQDVAVGRYGKLFPFLEKGDFGFVEGSNFRIPGSQALGDVHRPRVEGFGAPKAA